MPKNCPGKEHVFMSKCACMYVYVCTFPYITLFIGISFMVGAYNFTYFRLKLPPHSHQPCTEVMKGELMRQLQPSSCGRSVVTHIALQYYVVPPSVDWCFVSVSTTALSSGLVRGSLSNCTWLCTPRLFLSCPT